MKKRLFLSTLAISILSLGAISLSFAYSKNESNTLLTNAYSQSVNDYYANINWDLTGATLKTALFNKIKITTAGWSYDGLWEAYKTTDVRPDGTHFWDIYSDTTDYTLNDKRINASYKKEGDSINREHVIPQSSFNEAAPMKSDIHHVLPSDGYVNNRRSAYPHGIVTGSPTYTSNDGCKLGSGGSDLGTVFEPMDNYKGDIARIYFYFVTCYQDKMSSNSFTAFDKSTHPSIKTKYLNIYLQWAKDDPVSEKEIIRNQAAYVGQGNRNPFIDCPYAVGAIWDPDHASDYGIKGQYTSGEGLSISKTSLSMISGGTTTIKATSTSGSNITWSTSNSSVVSLSSSSSSSGSDITLTTGSAGTATITASTIINGKSYYQTCNVTVSLTKQVTSISLSTPKTSYAVDDDFVKPTVTATYNDDTQANVTNETSFTGYDLSVAGNYTVTASYSYGGATKTATYEISVSSSGGGGDISDYTVSTTPLTSNNITNNMKVVWGTSPTNLATSISSNWVYLSTTSSNWVIFTIEGTSSGFRLNSSEGYVYCSGAKKVEFSSTNNTTFTLRSDNLVTNGTAGTFYYNGTGLRPYTSGSYSDAFLYELIPNRELTDIDIDTYPSKMSYEVGECFDPTGLIISRSFNDKSSDTYAYLDHESEFTFDPSTSTPLTVEHDTVEITYGGFSCFFGIDVEVPQVLSSISFDGEYETNFVEGDTFVFGARVIANYESGSVEDVTTKVTYSGYDMTLIGEQTVTVSYSNKSKTYNITVSKGTLSSISLTGQTTTYTKNAPFSFDGTCTAIFANGYEKEVTPTNVSTPDMSTAGVKSVTVTFSYNGVTKSQSYDITVNSYRHVYEKTESLIGTITYTTDKEVISVDTLSTGNTSGYSQIDTTNHAYRLGSGSNPGSVSVISTTANIYKITVNARAYGSDSGVSLSIAGTDNTLTSSYSNYTKEFDSPVSSVAFATAVKSKRALIASFTVYTEIEEDIGQTEDCVGLEAFITNCMHMDYTENLGYCKDSEHHYYETAKEAFNALNEHQRSLFTGNSAYAAEWARLQAWASFNGDELNYTTYFLEVNPFNNSNLENSDNTIIIVVASAIFSAILLSVLLVVKKRKIR